MNCLRGERRTRFCVFVYPSDATVSLYSYLMSNNEVVFLFFSYFPLSEIVLAGKVNVDWYASLSYFSAHFFWGDSVINSHELIEGRLYKYMNILPRGLMVFFLFELIFYWMEREKHYRANFSLILLQRNLIWKTNFAFSIGGSATGCKRSV